MRLNIDSTFFIDGRISTLSMILEEHRSATEARLLRIWHHCYVKRTENLSETEILSQGNLLGLKYVSDLGKQMLSIGLADAKPDGIFRIKGVSKRIEFLKKQAEKGRLGGLLRNERRVKNQAPAKNFQANAKQAPSKCLAYSPTPTPSLSLISLSNDSSSISPSKNEEKSGENGGKLNPAIFAQIWNANCGTLPKCTKLSKDRSESIRCRIGENKDPAYWEGVIRKMAQSDFCRQGKWATIDWLTSNSRNNLKVFEGNYDNKKTEEEVYAEEMAKLREEMAEKERKEKENANLQSI